MKGKDSIILIGPMLVGKSTIARMLWDKYLYDYVDCDYYFDYYFRKKKKPYFYFDNLLNMRGIDECLKETDPFCTEFVLEILQMINETNEMSIVDFGGNHTSYSDSKYTKMVAEELRVFKNVILLLPSADREKSFRYFEKMINNPTTLELNKRIYDSSSNATYATKTFYTENLNEDMLFEQVDSYLRENNDMEKASIPDRGHALQLRRTANKYFPGAYNV